MSFKKIKYKNKYFAVLYIKKSDLYIPVILDWKDYIMISKLKRKWKCSDKGHIYYVDKTNNRPKYIYMHKLLLPEKKRIIHINNINFDNRRINIIYDEKNKQIKRNNMKKKRYIKLDGIKNSIIPTYVWYMKPDKTHGERFCVKIGNIKWKTNSSYNISLKEKLEQAKKFLRNIKKKNKKIFNEYSMNGEYNKYGKKILISFYDIVRLSGLHVNEKYYDDLTDKILCKN